MAEAPVFADYVLKVYNYEGEGYLIFVSFLGTSNQLK